jgi:cytochrome c556
MIQRAMGRGVIGRRALQVTLPVLALGAVAWWSCAAAAARPSKQEMEVEYRQSLYTVIGANFGPMGAMAQDKIPFDLAQVKLRSERVAFLAPMLKEAFPADSNGVAHTAAKPEIWTDADTFSKALQNLIDKSAALATTAKSGDTAAIKTAIQQTGQACKDCHDKFRVKDND